MEEGTGHGIHVFFQLHAPRRNGHILIAHLLNHESIAVRALESSTFGEEEPFVYKSYNRGPQTLKQPSTNKVRSRNHPNWPILKQSRGHLESQY